MHRSSALRHTTLDATPPRTRGLDTVVDLAVSQEARGPDQHQELAVRHREVETVDGANYFTAPIDSPRTRWFCAIQPTIITGSEASSAAAESWAQYRPSLVMNPTRNTGTVPARAAVRLTA